MSEHDARGAKAGRRGKLGHATHGTCARGPNADVMFVYVWSSYINLGLVIPGPLFPPRPSPRVRIHYRRPRFLSRQTYKLEILLIGSRRQPCLYPTTPASFEYV